MYWILSLIWALVVVVTRLESIFDDNFTDNLITLAPHSPNRELFYWNIISIQRQIFTPNHLHQIERTNKTGLEKETTPLHQNSLSPVQYNPLQFHTLPNKNYLVQWLKTKSIGFRELVVGFNYYYAHLYYYYY